MSFFDEIKIPGLSQSYDTNQLSPAISSHPNGADYWDAFISTVSEIPSHLKEDLGTGWDTTVSGAKKVVTGVTDVAATAVDPVINRVILLVAVLGVVIYFAGKSGALRISR